MSLLNAEYGKQYKISDVRTSDEELNNFLFSLGCCPGEDVTLVSKISGNYVVSIKDGRYSIDRDLADAIQIS